jgi:hypothetical protein
MVMPVPSTIDTMIVRLATTNAVGGSCSPRPDNRRLEALREGHAEQDAAERGDEPDDRRLHHHGGHHLSPAGSERAEQRQLAAAWLTTMLNVLKMMNAPTNSATNEDQEERAKEAEALARPDPAARRRPRRR